MLGAALFLLGEADAGTSLTIIPGRFRPVSDVRNLPSLSHACTAACLGFLRVPTDISSPITPSISSASFGASSSDVPSLSTSPAALSLSRPSLQGPLSLVLHDIFWVWHSAHATSGWPPLDRGWHALFILWHWFHGIGWGIRIVTTVALLGTRDFFGSFAGLLPSFRVTRFCLIPPSFMPVALVSLSVNAVSSDISSSLRLLTWDPTLAFGGDSPCLADAMIVACVAAWSSTMTFGRTLP